jgi:hypothetical protein
MCSVRARLPLALRRPTDRFQAAGIVWLLRI